MSNLQTPIYTVINYIEIFKIVRIFIAPSAGYFSGSRYRGRVRFLVCIILIDVKVEMYIQTAKIHRDLIISFVTGNLFLYLFVPSNKYLLPTAIFSSICEEPRVITASLYTLWPHICQQTLIIIAMIYWHPALLNRKWQDYVYIQCEYKSTKQKIKHLLREENKVKENKIS